MKGRRNPLVAGEGAPFVVLSLAAFAIALYRSEYEWAIGLGLLFLLLYLIFRDPLRDVPPAPLGVVSPVDGKVVSVETRSDGVLQGDAHCIRLRVNPLGTYTARSPTEGQILDLRSAENADTLSYPRNAMWIQTDEGDDVVLQFSGYWFGLPPRSLFRYGERVGQGKRAAYLRLGRYAEVHVATTARVLVEPGQKVSAGNDLIARLPAP